MVEQGDVEDATVLEDKIVQVDPFLSVDKLVDDLDLCVAGSGTDSSLTLSYIWEDVHTLRVELLFNIVVGAHQVPMHLQFELKMLSVRLSVL